VAIFPPITPRPTKPTVTTSRSRGWDGQRTVRARLADPSLFRGGNDRQVSLHTNGLVAVQNRPVQSYSAVASPYNESVSDTSVAETPPVQTGNDRHVLGIRLREARQRRGIGVRELSRQTNCSASLISQIELGKIAPSVSTLYTLTSLLGVSMDSLFVTEDKHHGEAAGRPEPSPPPASLPATTTADRGVVQRRATRPHISLEHGVRWERLNPSPEADAEFLEILYDVGGGSVSGDRAIRHNGREYGLVLEGVLSVQVGFETYILEAGDSVAFDSTVPHRFWNSGDVPVRAVWFELKPEWPDAAPGSGHAAAFTLH
jgi:mannose-6-phosphate isomerase-like protein (cupin superfamily)/DNA-binding XRE family transcriptional regulator